MKIPPDRIIPQEKLARYLLVLRAHDDKPRFLSRAGFTAENPKVLMKAIGQLAATCEAVPDGKNKYGEFYRVEGDLLGTEGRRLSVVTIWLRWQLDGMFRFVTLKPQKGG
jgi:hypothetical protein